MANLNHIIGWRRGADRHSAISTLRQRVSMPSTEVTVATCAGSATRFAVDDSNFAAVAEHFGALADDQGFQRGARSSTRWQHPAAVPRRDDGPCANS